MPIGGSLAIAGGSLASGIIGSNAASSAADKQAQAAANALAFQQNVFNTNQTNAAPFMNAGITALGQANNTLGAGMNTLGSATNAVSGLQPYMSLGAGAAGTLSQLYNGAPGGNGQPDYSAFYNSPDYQFARDQGTAATQNVLSAQGNLMSGGGLTALTNYGQGLASQQYGNYFNRLMGLANVGQSASNQAIGAYTNIGQGYGQLGRGYTDIGTVGANVATNTATTNANLGNTIGNTNQAIGQAQASGIVGSANAVTGAIGSGMGNQLQYMNLLRPGGTGSSYGSAPSMSSMWGGSSLNPSNWGGSSYTTGAT